MTLRAYDPERDRDAVHRIWMECGWIGDDAKERASMDAFVDGGRVALVSDVDGAAECLVVGFGGSIRHQHRRMPLGVIGAVTTSRIARGRGLARRLTAEVMRRMAAEGDTYFALGVFEQGYYDALGFGSAPYDHFVRVAPSALRVPRPSRPPVRFGPQDFEAVHACRERRLDWHGSVTIASAASTRESMMVSKNGFGLGFRDRDDGGFSHLAWFSAPDVGTGPYTCHWQAFETWPQYLELLGVIKNLGEQVRTVRLYEPAGLQLQDFVTRPFERHARSRNGKYPEEIAAISWAQLRIADLEAAVSAARFPVPAWRFNLQLTDPIDDWLSSSEGWSGLTGAWIVTLGEACEVTRGEQVGLPTLVASVNAFSRLWFGVSTAHALALSEGLEADTSVLDQLDATIRLPRPVVDWDM